MQPSQYIVENKKRNALLDAPYNPLAGTNSPIERFEYFLIGDIPVKLPVTMKTDDRFLKFLEFDSLEQYWQKKFPNDKVEKFFDEIFTIREDHDFEYWAALKVKIKPKEGGNYIPFKLNQPQRKVLKELEKMRVNNLPIRMIIDKARQWGGSTLTQVYMAWIQIKHKTNWNSLIAAQINQQATNIRFMYSNLVKYYPDEISLKPFEGMNNIKWIPERNCKITVGSMQTPESIRSDDVAMSHLSEVAFWKKTEGKEPKDLVQAIQGTIPTAPYTCYVLESTAKGVGNFFHKSWLNAINGDSNLVPVFVAWFEIEKYRTPFDSDEEVLEFIKSMDDYELWLWELGATLEGIKWYRFKLAEFEGDTWRMRSEYPSTWQESFQATGRRVYAPSIVEKTRKNCRKPNYRGYLYADAFTGKDALKNISFEEDLKGDLWIWEMPDKSVNIENRYLVSVDIGGKSIDADWTVIRVIDRYWMMFGGVPEFILTWRFHADKDVVAWRAVQIGEMYNHALVAIENNSFDKEENTEGEGYLTVLNEVVEYYDNLYITPLNRDKVKEGAPVKYGFHTNQASKEMIITCKNAAMRDEGYIERDARACDESDKFERKEDGKKTGAVESQNDDIEISTNIGLWIALNDMDMPYEVDKSKMNDHRAKAKKRIKSEASF